MKPIILLSTYKVSHADQWDLCRMLEHAGVSEFDFVTLETRRHEELDKLLEELQDSTIVALDDTSIKFAEMHLQETCRILKWFLPSLSYLPPKVNGQQLADVLNREATTEDEEASQP